MKAIICNAPGALELIDRNPPERAGGQVLVDIRFVGICGTDAHIYQGKHPSMQYPRVLGHELSGVVAESDDEAQLPAGTPVFISPYLPCGTCIACRKGRPNCCARLRVIGVHSDGGMCERIAVPKANVHAIGNLPLRDAAMIEFLAVGAHAVRRSEAGSADRTLVVGAGPIGIGAALFARHAGADVTIMDVSEARLDYMKSRLGFTSLLLANGEAHAAAGRMTSGDYFDVVFDATGNKRAMESSFGFVAHTGTMVLVGLLDAMITFSDPEFHRREMRLFASRNALPPDFDLVMRAITEGRVPTEAINTHTIPLADLPAAMPEWLASAAPPVKAMLSV